MTRGGKVKGRARRGAPRTPTRPPAGRRWKSNSSGAQSRPRNEDGVPKLCVNLLSTHANVKGSQQTCYVSVFGGWVGGGGVKLSQCEQIHEALADAKH